MDRHAFERWMGVEWISLTREPTPAEREEFDRMIAADDMLQLLLGREPNVRIADSNPDDAANPCSELGAD